MTSIYFVRHAQPEHGWKEDRTRPLSAEGRRECIGKEEILIVEKEYNKKKYGG